jgi:hypothetical protein
VREARECAAGLASVGPASVGPALDGPAPLLDSDDTRALDSTGSTCDHVVHRDLAYRPSGPHGAVSMVGLSTTPESAQGLSVHGSIAPARVIRSLAATFDLSASGSVTPSSSGSPPGSAVHLSTVAAPPLQLDRPHTHL